MPCLTVLPCQPGHIHHFQSEASKTGSNESIETAVVPVSKIWGQEEGDVEKMYDL